jgi:hypothetical protein
MTDQTHTFPLTADYAPQVGDVITSRSPYREDYTLTITRVDGDEVSTTCSWARGEIMVKEFARTVRNTAANAFGNTIIVTRKEASAHPATCPHCGQTMPEEHAP